MNIIELSKYLNDETLAESYLLEKGILKKFILCPHCSSEKIGNIRRGRLKCYRCKKEWHKRKDSFLESKHIAFSKFIGFMKLYCDEVNPLIMSAELEIERKTIIEMFAKLKKKILLANNIVNNNFEKMLLSVIKGDIHIEQYENLNSTKYKSYFLLDLKLYKEFGNIYSFLVDAELHGYKTGFEINLMKSFLSYIKMKSLSYKGISEKYFVDYLLELVVKFNNRGLDYYELILKWIKYV